MWLKFSGTDVPFRAPNKKKEIKMEYRLFHDVVAKALYAKADSFDVVTSEKFDLLVAISAGHKVNWAQQPMEARSQAAPAKSKFGTSSDEDSRPLAKLKRGGAKRKLVVESSDSESTVSVPPVLITKKHRTKRTKNVKSTAGTQAESQPGPIPDSPARADKASIAGGPEATMETPPEVERQADDGSIAADQKEHEECGNRTDREPVTDEGTIVVRSGPEQPAQQSMTFAGKGAWLRPISRGTRHFNGWRFWPPNPIPRPESQFLRRSALENSTKISRTEYPRRNGQNEISDGGGGDGGEERKNKLRSFWDTASRGLTTFVTPKPHFRTNPSDHGKASSNIAP
ncbi:thylakoid lumenal 29 kDa protein, chloroplastic [Dorcoceras hygrometricum]|uniref:Thylakoid lumenal 29 kDa protein, chloroplastic n=1 Tax=Dorcoceras hygrometricum TaxID=472368 RepID=A0A2Z7BTR5_9LAMI|nr:thylakoid lumenal 29 kDa protein, chloroplastic [Dorcoceras hygrometricum]